ncbi:Tfp assembly type protein [Sporosarcina sp. P18a]|uniref:prepilin-type N-terminal cleavage/methylation domain-containing protein n=1 Tax=Sporosarcina sp. P18a TaxID=2048259 RepID=UPI000C172442|nr:prepilin-type N-terminal cleavage/methylation domain-containing protein [Sporosarcina sp. P18a]PIC80625.1 Tfp assembly type protein [Sporosarcina sp. P18a]
MKKFMQKKLNQKGLTLVELLAVIVILGIIAAIAVPAIGNIIENTKYNAVKSDALNALSAANLLYAEDQNAKDVTVKTLVDGGYLDNKGKLTDAMTFAKSANNVVSISGNTAEYAGGKKVTFTSATVEIINTDKTKGSAAGDKTIKGAVATP